jgi:hypothetical protein
MLKQNKIVVITITPFPATLLEGARHAPFVSWGVDSPAPFRDCFAVLGNGFEGEFFCHRTAQYQGKELASAPKAKILTASTCPPIGALVGLTA